ncbi:hypothetical protein [Nocardioides sp. AX2bis]|uniref:hypothetical protein n=1 Tax=Nocardioides sp. AX2bis TaxID=2653157 RepID=UPI0012F25D92|nr:hypothetical protein [Nocardioides sp. AX2bis]VXC43823.1 hypothetical protein NOCARDAX2BIS_590004 [Nocardioides sp. AX2bis]
MPDVDVRTYADLQAACDASSLNGTTVVVPTGVVIDSPQIFCDSRLTLRVDGRINRTDAGNTGAGGAMFRNRNTSLKTNDCHFFGKGSVGAKTSYTDPVTGHTRYDQTGIVFSNYGDRNVWTDIGIDKWDGGQAWAIRGDDLVIRRTSARGCAEATGNGGMRLIGGARFRAYSCDVWSGDDVYQPVPSPSTDHTITDAKFINCVGGSTDARFMVVGIQAGSGETLQPGTPMTCSVEDVEWRNCHGHGSIMGVVLQNFSSTGRIHNMRFTGCSVQSSRQYAGTNGARVLGQEFYTTALHPDGSVTGGVDGIHGDITWWNRQAATLMNPGGRGPVTGVDVALTERADPYWFPNLAPTQTPRAAFAA